MAFQFKRIFPQQLYLHLLSHWLHCNHHTAKLLAVSKGIFIEQSYLSTGPTGIFTQQKLPTGSTDIFPWLSYSSWWLHWHLPLAKLLRAPVESSQSNIKLFTGSNGPQQSKTTCGSTSIYTGHNCLLAPMESSQSNIKLFTGSSKLPTEQNYLLAPLASPQSITACWLQWNLHRAILSYLLAPMPVDSTQSNTTCWLHWHWHKLFSGSSGIFTQSKTPCWFNWHLHRA